MSKPSNANPFAKFFWNDWASDPCLRLCSAAARGMWMEILCLCAKSDGYLKINGKAVTMPELAAIAGIPEAETLVAELEIRGVFSRTRKGVIYSRRMVRDVERQRIAIENGKLGGNPNLRKSTTKSQGVNPHYHSHSHSHNHKGEGDTSFSLESEPSESEKSASKAKRKSRLPEGWRPSSPLLADLERQGYSAAELELELPKFQDHHKARGNVMADWPAAFRTWMRKSREFAERNGRGAAPRRSRDDGMAICDEGLERARGQDRYRRPDPFDIAFKRESEAIERGDPIDGRGPIIDHEPIAPSNGKAAPSSREKFWRPRLEKAQRDLAACEDPAKRAELKRQIQQARKELGA